MNSEINAPYTTLAPGSQEHKDFIANAILTRNHYQLSALKGRTKQPIHLVSNWFHYNRFRQGIIEDVVAIYTPTDCETIQRMQNQELTNQN